MDFLKNKTVKVFNIDYLKEGYFISYKYAGTYGGCVLNGMIKSTTEDYITIMRYDGSSRMVKAKDVINGSIVILGVRENVSTDEGDGRELI